MIIKSLMACSRNDEATHILDSGMRILAILDLLEAQGLISFPEIFL